MPTKEWVKKCFHANGEGEASGKQSISQQKEKEKKTGTGISLSQPPEKEQSLSAEETTENQPALVARRASWYRETAEEAKRDDLIINQYKQWKQAAKEIREENSLMEAEKTKSEGEKVKVFTVEEFDDLISPIKELFHSGKSEIPLGPKVSPPKPNSSHLVNIKKALGVKKKIRQSPFCGAKIHKQAAFAVADLLREEKSLCGKLHPSTSETAPIRGKNPKKTQDPVVGEKPPAAD